ncbi:MAG: penicillin-binding protein [Deferribacteres bacterium]|nr:penicillin-binding protein [candidate division KSB1 bacterium]MCB9501198.1 penicillin-binding protein [Deferribacteres bacterium]
MTKNLFYSFIALCSLVLVIVYAGFFYISSTLPYIPNDLRQLVFSQPTEIFADDGSLVYSLRGQEYVPLEQISPNFYNALVATEDAKFYSHHGIDPLGLMRAVIFMGKRGGGSTLTQQLGKVLFFTYRSEILRKFKDMLLAMQLESMFSKDQILEAYCNFVYFGGSAYGIEDASQQYFSKPASDLSIAEGAMLAGIINAPNLFNPFTNPERAKTRQRLVLSRMKKVGLLSEDEFDQALTDSLTYVSRRQRGSDYVDYVLAQAGELFGDDAVQYGGLKIYTALDPDLQRVAERALSDGIARLEASLDTTGAELQGAMAVVSVATGEVKALIGGRKRIPGGFNRAVSENRHVGSGIKPFIYYTAMEKLDLTPRSVRMDTATSFYAGPGQPLWRVRNFDRIYRGPVTLKWALMQSINVVSAQITKELTPEVVVDAAKRFGITSPFEPNISLSIGTGSTSPLQMASAYAIFARNGMYYPPVCIKRVEDAGGIVIHKALIRFGDQRLDEKLSYMTLDMMKGYFSDLINNGRIIRANGFRAPGAGKTGTSTDYTDAWFNGVTSSLSATVWVGYDRNYQMYRKNRRGVTGTFGAVPIWANFMRVAQRRYPAREFKMPDGLKQEIVDRITGWPTFDENRALPVVLPEKDASGILDLDLDIRGIEQDSLEVDSLNSDFDEF